MSRAINSDDIDRLERKIEELGSTVTAINLLRQEGLGVESGRINALEERVAVLEKRDAEFQALIDPPAAQEASKNAELFPDLEQPWPNQAMDQPHYGHDSEELGLGQGRSTTDDTATAETTFAPLPQGTTLGST